MSKLTEMITLEAARQGRKAASMMTAEDREAAAMNDFQDESIEACVDFGLQLTDDTEEFCGAFTSAFVKAAVACADSMREVA